jgi:transcriptional regulator with XRE-family HTH domain
MTFGERLRQLRDEAGMTQVDLAEASGLPLGSLRNYEQGQREPYWSVIFKLAEALGVPVEAFRACLSDEKPAAIYPRRRKSPSAVQKPKRGKRS